MRRDKVRRDFHDFRSVMLSFIASVNAKKLFDANPKDAVNWYIDFTFNTNRPDASRIARENQEELESEYMDWALRQQKKKLAHQNVTSSEEDIVEAAINLLEERGYMVIKP